MMPSGINNNGINNNGINSSGINNNGINNSLKRDLEHQLLQKAQAMGMERARAAQSNIAENLQNAVPDGAVEPTSDGRVILRARRLFSRMINDERLRDPHIFMSERFKG